MLIGGGAVLGHLFLYRRLAKHLVLGRRGRIAIAVVLAAMTALLVLRRPLRSIGGQIEHVYALVAYTWIAFALCLLVWMIAKDGLLLAARAVERARDNQPDLERRALVQRALSAGALAGGGLTTVYGTYRAFASPEITEVAVRLPRLPRHLDGLTIVQLSDVHVGPFIDARFLERIVELVNAQRPDLVAITGDLVDDDVAVIGPAVATLAKLRSRWGTCFVTGNHEYHSDEVAWTRFLDRLGMKVLRNRRVEIGDAAGTIDLVGVDDWSGGRRRGRAGYDLDAALVDRDPERAAVLLSHQPQNFDVAASRGIGLQLSGHTHGGQLFPMTALIGLGWKYSRGLYRHDDSRIYVSRGCGFWGPPARVGSPPEIVKVTLVA